MSMHYSFFATTYGQSPYNSNNYNGTNTTGSSGGSSSGGSAGGASLTNTGFDALLVVTLAAVILLTAVVVRFIKRPAKKTG